MKKLTKNKLKSYAFSENLPLKPAFKNQKSGFLNLFDELELEILKQKKIILITNKKKIPNNNLNSIYQISKIFFDLNKLNYGLKINLNKKIPLNSGLKGAKSNALTVFLFLTKEFEKYKTLSEKQDFLKKYYPKILPLLNKNNLTDYKLKFFPEINISPYYHPKTSKKKLNQKILDNFPEIKLFIDNFYQKNRYYPVLVGHGSTLIY
jgi:hypothetical protein